MERRKTENAALRELISALKVFVDARDCVWTLGAADRLFRRERCRDTLQNYDKAMGALREAIVGLMSASRGPVADTKAERQPALISVEEFRMLLEEPGDGRRRETRGSRWRTRMTGGPKPPDAGQA